MWQPWLTQSWDGVTRSRGKRAIFLLFPLFGNNVVLTTFIQRHLNQVHFTADNPNACQGLSKKAPVRAAREFLLALGGLLLPVIRHGRIV